MDHTAIEENLGGICDPIEFLQRLVELIIIVTSKGSDPGLDFLQK
jgi:hypothetical protein